MNEMFFDPELLKLWDAQAAMAPPMAGVELAKIQAATPLPTPPLPPPSPPPLPAAGPDGATVALPAASPDGAAAALPATKPEPLAGQEPPGFLTWLGLTGGGMKAGQPSNLAAVLRGLASMMPQPAPGQRQASSAAPAPPFHRPQAGALAMRQPIPGNPYLRTATPGTPAIRSRRRGLLDEG